MEQEAQQPQMTQNEIRAEMRMIVRFVSAKRTVVAFWGILLWIVVFFASKTWQEDAKETFVANSLIAAFCFLKVFGEFRIHNRAIGRYRELEKFLE